MSKYNFKSTNGLILVSSRIHSSYTDPSHNRDVRLILDTGCSFTIIIPDAISGLGYDHKNPIRMQKIITASDEIECPVIKLSYFHCMGQIIKDFEVVIHSIPKNRSSGFSFEGLLGTDFLGKFDMKISFSKGYIEVYKTNQHNQSNRKLRKYRPRQN